MLSVGFNGCRSRKATMLPESNALSIDAMKYRSCRLNPSMSGLWSEPSAMLVPFYAELECTFEGVYLANYLVFEK